MSSHPKGAFANLAPALRSRGLWPRPISEGTKACKLPKWQTPDAEIGDATLNGWLTKYPDHGVGLLMGSPLSDATRIAAVDIDRDAYVPLAKAILGEPPCYRIGKKGAAFFVRVSGNLPNRPTFQIRGEASEERNPVGEFLFAKSLCVTPPTIHPDTGAPYRWQGVSLLDIDFSKLPHITSEQVPADGNQIPFGLLRVILESEHIPTLMTGEGTHDACLRLVAQIVPYTQNEAYIASIVQSALPAGYGGNTLEEVPGFIRSALAKGFDEPAKRKSKDRSPLAMADVIINEAMEAGIELVNAEGLGGFVSWPLQSGGRVNIRTDSRQLGERLRHLHFVRSGKSVPDSALQQAIQTLQARAVFGQDPEQMYQRIGKFPGGVVLDLGREDGKVVRIGPEGWEVTIDCPARMWRSAGSMALPEPRAGGNLERLRLILRLDPENWLLLVGFLINCLSPTGSYMCLLLEGEQGSGKSMLCALAKRLIDPHMMEKSRLPSKPQDLMIQAKEQHLMVFDNTSFIKDEISDVLCTIATGGADGRRRLYSDADLHIIKVCKPFIINGISDFANRPDLLERGIPARLVSIPEDQRRTEAEMRAEFEEALPELLGCLCDAVSMALRRIGTISKPRGFRMADAAVWIAAAEPALVSEKGAILRAIKDAQLGVMRDRVENDPIVVMLRELLAAGPFEGSVTELHERLSDKRTPPFDRSFPSNASGLSKQLHRLRPLLKETGIFLEFPSRTRKSRLVRIWLEGQEGQEPAARPQLPKY